MPLPFLGVCPRPVPFADMPPPLIVAVEALCLGLAVCACVNVSVRESVLCPVSTISHKPADGISPNFGRLMQLRR